MLVEELTPVFARAFDALSSFVNSPAFRRLLDELWAVPEQFRHEFVELVILDSHELERRAIFPSEDSTVQRSWFADDRPTLFCVTKHLPTNAGWKKVTITFDKPR